jgi:hypothetical protein
LVQLGIAVSFHRRGGVRAERLVRREWSNPEAKDAFANAARLKAIGRDKRVLQN